MAPHSLAAPEAEVVAALGLDDQCGANGGDCALNALQVKSAKLAPEAEEGDLSALDMTIEEVHAAMANATEENACTSGMVGQIRAFSPSCIDACPQMCGPLAQAL